MAGIVAAIGAPDTAVAAALLHDVREDVPWVTHQILVQRFGAEVALLVSEVTKVSRPSDGNRQARKQIDREHRRKASEWGQTITIADVISNVRDLVDIAPGFAVTYLPEKLALLEVLSLADAVLRDHAIGLVIAGLHRLNASNTRGGAARLLRGAHFSAQPGGEEA